MKCHLHNQTICIYFGFSWGFFSRFAQTKPCLKRFGWESFMYVCVCVRKSVGEDSKWFGHGAFPKVNSPCHLKLEGSQRPTAVPSPPQRMMIRREARAQHLPVLFVWFTTIWIAEAKKGIKLQKKTSIEISVP